MRFCFILERGNPPRFNPIVAETFEILGRHGHQVTALYPEEELLRLDTLRVEADLYLLKSDTEFALSLACALNGLGAKVLNRYEACLLAKDKTLAANVLLRAGIPTPRSFAAAEPARLAGELGHSPLILKPHRGYHGAGIAVVEDQAALDQAPYYPDMVFAQDYLAQARRDLKIFAIGEQIFAVRKAFAADSFLKAGEPAALPPAIEAIARGCGAAFGLELYGLDIAEQAGEAYVVDVNYFPGYRGVPEAAPRLAAHFITAARG